MYCLYIPQCVGGCGLDKSQRNGLMNTWCGVELLLGSFYIFLNIFIIPNVDTTLMFLISIPLKYHNFNAKNIKSFDKWEVAQHYLYIDIVNIINKIDFPYCEVHLRPQLISIHSTDYTCSQTSAEYFAKPSEKGLEMTMSLDETS